ncbi:MAG: hypothetical protein ACKVGZ_01770, partial [Alphaproteobacteria bacterium]
MRILARLSRSNLRPARFCALRRLGLRRQRSLLRRYSLKAGGRRLGWSIWINRQSWQILQQSNLLTPDRLER